MNLATCIGCGCDDEQACECGCTWLRLNRDAGLGVCSKCPGYVSLWDGGNRKLCWSRRRPHPWPIETGL